MIIFRLKNVIFESFWPLPKFHFPACSTLDMTKKKDKYLDGGKGSSLVPDLFNHFPYTNGDWLEIKLGTNEHSLL